MKITTQSYLVESFLADASIIHYPHTPTTHTLMIPSRICPASFIICTLPHTHPSTPSYLVWSVLTSASSIHYPLTHPQHPHTWYDLSCLTHHTYTTPHTPTHPHPHVNLVGSVLTGASFIHYPPPHTHPYWRPPTIMDPQYFKGISHTIMDPQMQTFHYPKWTVLEVNGLTVDLVLHLLYCRPMTKGHNWQFCQKWVITTNRSRMTISTHWKCQMHQFTLLNPKKFSSKSEFYVQANGSQAQ